MLGKKVKVASDFGWVFRIQGHAWSSFLLRELREVGVRPRSFQLVIAYDCSDTMGAVGYVYAEGGKVLESLSFVDGEVEFRPNCELSSLRRRSSITSQTTSFASARSTSRAFTGALLR